MRRAQDSSKEIHVCNVKQFFLEAYISTQPTLNAMLAPLKTAKWIDLRSFVSSLEALQTLNYEQQPLAHHDDWKSTRDSLRNQKLNCEGYTVFFKLVDYGKKNALVRTEVKTALSMALRSKQPSNESLNLIVDKTFSKANDARGFASEFLTFDEFHAALRG